MIKSSPIFLGERKNNLLLEKFICNGREYVNEVFYLSLTV